METEVLRRLLIELGAPEGLVLAMVGNKAIAELQSAAAAKALAERSVELAARGIRMIVPQPADAAADE